MFSGVSSGRVLWVGSAGTVSPWLVGAGYTGVRVRVPSMSQATLRSFDTSTNECVHCGADAFGYVASTPFCSECYHGLDRDTLHEYMYGDSRSEDR